MSNDYTGNAAKLLSLGEIEAFGEWRDYLKLGLTADDVPDLLRMIDDESLYDLDLSGAEGWAPIHAWRALGQLRAAEAAEPLIRRLNRIETDDDEWALEDIPTALALIGQPAIAPTVGVLANSQASESVRIAAVSALVDIASEFPEHRTEVVNVLTDFLERQEEARTLNAFVILGMVGLKAVESAGAIEAVYRAGVVDLFIMGDWEQAQIALGLLDKRVTPEPSSWLQMERAASGHLTGTDDMFQFSDAIEIVPNTNPSVQNTQRRKARKSEKAARKQQRAKKKKKRK